MKAVFYRQKLAFKRYCMRHRHLYRLFSRWFRRRTNRAMREARRLKGIDRNMVLFCSYRMEAFNDNPYYICQALHAMRPETELVWMFTDVEKARARYDIPDWVRCVQWDTPEGLEALGRARVLVDNWRKKDYLRLGREQVYLFSPHHDRSFKQGVLTYRDRLYGRVLEAHADAATVGSAFCKRMLRAAYRFRGPYIEAGLPRNDILLRDDPADAARIRARLGVDEDARILLYAPTFRDADSASGCRQTVTLDLNRVMDVLEEVTGARWLCMYRAHYASLGLNLDHLPRQARLKNVTDYPEMAELLRVADALITDYSCCAGDYALRGKPIWLYVADIDDYTARSRELFLNPLDTPFWCARDPDALEALIRGTTRWRAEANCREILRFYGEFETGFASEAAAAYICEKLG